VEPKTDVETLGRKKRWEHKNLQLKHKN
jgi:hypothetical protein